MASHLTGSEFQIGSSQAINGVSTTLNNSDSEIPTSKAVKSYIDNKIPVSLTVSGNWTNTQCTSLPVDTTGLTFTVTYKSGTTASITPSVRPLVWSDTIGTQTATFYYTECGVTVSASKSASVVDPLSIPLTLYAREAGNITALKTGESGTIYYSKNGGSQTVINRKQIIPVSAGDKVSFYRTLSSNLYWDKYFTITCSSNCYVYGNIMSLYDKDNFASLDTISYTHPFYSLFNSNTHIDINGLILPATTLSDACYSNMFYGCTSLTTAPALPATTLAASCYSYMFNGCTSLTSVPSLPATTLADYCYSNMFNGCTNLTAAPVLPATTLATYCYEYMFRDCTNLTTAPASLPATTLAKYCYQYMFRGCTNLTTAPVLSATTLARSCCEGMFEGCTSLTTAPASLPATTLADTCYAAMFGGCSSLTTAPTLPATTLTRSCYNKMFYDCTNLTTAPVLPATTLAESCYYGMFRRCSNLTSITCLATNISESNCTKTWVDGVASSGTFITPSSTPWTTGMSGIPSGWTRVNA